MARRSDSKPTRGKRDSKRARSVEVPPKPGDGYLWDSGSKQWLSGAEWLQATRQIHRPDIESTATTPPVSPALLAGLQRGQELLELLARALEIVTEQLELDASQDEPAREALLFIDGAYFAAFKAVQHESEETKARWAILNAIDSVARANGDPSDALGIVATLYPDRCAKLDRKKVARAIRSWNEHPGPGKQGRASLLIDVLRDIEPTITPKVVQKLFELWRVTRPE